MAALIIILTIIQSFSISLGVGASTLAVLNFFAAIADGIIDETERHLMGLVYIVLRVAMVLILISSISLSIISYATEIVSFGYVFALYLTMTVLYANAVLMTLHYMPSTFGPAIQAASWYTLGMLSILATLGLTTFVWWQFALAYVTGISLAVSLINGVMAYLKERHDWGERETSSAS